MKLSASMICPLLILIIPTWLWGSSSIAAQQQSSCRQPNDDDNVYALAKAQIILQMHFFLDTPNPTLTADQLSELSAMSNSIANEMEDLAGTPMVRQLLTINHIPLPQPRKNAYKIVVVNDSAVGAWSCQLGTATRYEMRISSAFFAGALSTAMNQAIHLANNLDDGMGMGPITLNFQDELTSPKDIIAATNRLMIKPATKDNTPAESIVNYADTMGMREDLQELETLATIQYLKLLAFVIGHESGHMWVDGCAENTSETRADDFGFVLSSLLLDEQMVHAAMFNAATLSDVGFKQKFYEFRKVARQHSEVPATNKNPLIGSNALAACYSHWAHLSDADLDKRALALSKVADREFASLITELPSTFREPVSKKGFEIFTQIYVDLALQEFIAGDKAHPALEIRKARLENKYNKESDIVSKLYKQLISHSVQVSEQAANSRSEYIEGLLAPAVRPDVCALPPKERIPTNDPCLSPPPDPEELDQHDSE